MTKNTGLDKLEAYIKREEFFSDAMGCAIREAHASMTAHGMKANLALDNIEEIIDACRVEGF